MKSTLKIFGLAGLTMALVFGVGLRLREVPVRAQAAASASTPEVQAGDANKLEHEQEQDEDDVYRKSPTVLKLGGKLGLNPEQSFIVFDVLNFLLLAGGVGWIAVKSLPKIFRDRNSSIQKHLVDARTATEEARGRLSSVEARLAKLDDEIAAMRTQAEQDSAKEQKRIKASVEEEKNKILAAAEQEIHSATLHAQKILQQHAAELAIEQAARKLVVSAETDRLLVQGFAQRLTGDDSKKGQN